MSVEPVPPHGLWAFDIATSDFAKTCAADSEAGAALASADTERLWALARRVATDLAAWTVAHQGLSIASSGAFPPERWGDRLVEALFEDALTPPAAQVFAASLALASAPVIVPPTPRA
jgi:hypothetical protein